MFNRILLSALLVSTVGLGAVATASPVIAAAAASGKKAAPVPAKFGLTEAMGTMLACPNARFEGDAMMALGGVLQENQAKVNAAPVNERMALMQKLVADETARANAWAKGRKLNCEQAAEQAAGYWNRTIQTMAKAQQAEAQAKQAAAPVKPAAATVPAKPGAAVSLP